MNTFDTAALTAPVTRAEVQSFRDEEATNWRWDDTAGLAIGGTVVAAVLLGVLPFLTVTLIDLTGAAVEIPAPARIIPPIVILAAIAWLFSLRVRSWRDWERRLRLARFSSANALTYTAASDIVTFPGELFQLGNVRQRFSFFRTRDSPPTEYGAYRWTTGYGQYQQIHIVGYVAIRHGRPLPHLILDTGARPAHAPSGLWGNARRREHSVSLAPGTTLSCLPVHEADARRLFDDAVLAAMTGQRLRFDVELIDDWVILNSDRPFDVLDPAVWLELHAATHVLIGRVQVVYG